MAPPSLAVLLCSAVVLVLASRAHGISVHFAHRFGGRVDDLQGRYCEGRNWGSTGSRWWAAGRSSVCCNGRLDDCSVPILGTLCYCDQFCDRGVTHDCCPDYWDVCTDTPRPPVTPPPEPIARCIHNGREFNVGQIIQDNCNTCECVPSQGAAPSASCTRNKCLLDPALSSALRREPALGWTAVEVPMGGGGGDYSEFWGRSLADGIKLRLGTLEPDLSVQGMQKVQFYVNESVPETFDARRTWNVISPPLDQGWCASSWALSAGTVISDRASIADRSVGALMYEHLLECQPAFSSRDKCAAGHLHRVWKLLSDYGAPERECIVNRAPTEATCRPRPRPTCKRERSGPAYRLGDMLRIQDNIRWYGPIQATMRVYQDFFHYRGGVYSRPAGSDSRESHGYHSVRIIGWGEDRSDPRRAPIPYWLAVNSWGTWWGEGGYFRIKRGVNECDIEKYMLGAWIQPELSSLSGPYRPRPSSRRGR
ncbi:tubulointerstitial nephritis antigen-like [Ischnura elegans]|uniref:tubulointerstitial nephritis antigen-like n=1 Tax=Ischnura elegans TaxID=197161 RepID=UPI001ED8AC2F|nr:tubulointerstitial nephritis antigen-like [Ischnura elegans]